MEEIIADLENKISTIHKGGGEEAMSRHKRFSLKFFLKKCLI